MLPPRVPGLCVGVEIEPNLSTTRVCFQLFCCNPGLVSSSCPRGLSLEDDTENKCLPRNVSKFEVIRVGSEIITTLHFKAVGTSFSSLDSPTAL